MSKRFKLCKSTIPSQLSNFCDENGRMLNSEVVRILNNRDALQESNIKMFFLIKEMKSKIKRLEEKNEQLQKQIEENDNMIDLCSTCIYCLSYEAMVSFESYVRTTRCFKRGKIDGVLNKCEDYKSI